MKENTRRVVFLSVLGRQIANLVADRRALGYKYDNKEMLFMRLDRFLMESGLDEVRLPKEIVSRWVERNPNESRGNQLKRVLLIRQLALYLVSNGIEAHVPDPRLFPKPASTFRPRILTRDEVRRILKAADSLPKSALSPLYAVTMPLIFRLLYGCGLRVSEVLKLRMKDLDRQKGVLTIRQAKFMKDRLVPVAPGLWSKVENYILIHRFSAGTDDFLFQSPLGGRYAVVSIYGVWRDLLWKSGVVYEGRGKGPRLHDLRHTFAVHRLASWHAAGEDLSTLLPVLSAYLGHVNMRGTQRYLHLAAELYPEMTGRLERDHGHAIPGRARP